MLMAEIKLDLHSGKKTTQRIPLILGKTKTNSAIYKDEVKKANEIIIELDNISDKNRSHLS